MSRASTSLISLIIALIMLLGPSQRASALRSISASKALTKASKSRIRKGVSTGKAKGSKGKKSGKGHHKGGKSKSRGKRKANWFAKRVGANLKRGMSFKQAVARAKKAGHGRVGSRERRYK